MKKNILMIASEFPPCGGGGVGRISAIAESLAKNGDRITVITANKEHFSIFDYSLTVSHENLKIVTVYSFPIRKFLWRMRRYIPSFKYLDNYSLWSVLAKIKVNSLQKTKSFDLVISSYPSMSNHSVAFFISKKFNIPWIADYRDPPSFLYDSSQKKQKCFYNYTKQALINCVTTKNAKEMISAGLQVSPKKLYVVQNGCSKIASTINQTNPEDGGFELVHTGSFYENGRDINQLIEAIDSLSTPVKMRFIGDEPYNSTKELLLKINNPERIEFISYMNSDEVLKISAACSALIVIQGNLFTNQIPGKLFEYLALEKPILLISNKGSATHIITLDEPNVIFAEYGDIESIKLGLINLKSHKVVGIDRSKYTREKMAKNFISLLDII
ncbi:glycosyltransferase [Alishewanella sp. SMS8]|uniref:glycosyltransferase n=1 Tax=Alishewanella sp. SMS8 TaxID=2994676 RepID=UPI002741280B|nr:glycosyltransferase [Alishewanella sp. SMS8]MDP5458157.1 glycosyltransferase [Alishewanella sp. SMS8]